MNEAGDDVPEPKAGDVEREICGLSLLEDVLVSSMSGGFATAAEGRGDPDALGTERVYSEAEASSLLPSS